MRPALVNPAVHPFSAFDIPHLLHTHAMTRGDHPFMICEPFEGEAETWTYAGFEDATARVAAGLKARGVKQEDIVSFNYSDYKMDVYGNGIIVSPALAVNETS